MLEKLEDQPGVGEGRIQSARGGAGTRGVGYSPHPLLPEGCSQLIYSFVCSFFTLLEMELRLVHAKQPV